MPGPLDIAARVVLPRAALPRPPRGGGGPPGGFFGRAANAGFAVAQWESLFSRWFPSLTLTSTVSAQGDKKTPNKAVLHAALSVAFGSLTNRRLADIGLKVKVNHTDNSVLVGFGVATNPLLDLTNLLGVALEELLDSITEGEGALPGVLATAILGPGGALVARGILKVIEQWWEDAPWVKKRKQPGAAAPPNPGDIKRDGGGAGERLDKMLARIWDKINKEIGGGAVWTLAREEIKGGQAPKFLQTFEAQQPFDDMRGEVQLTRAPAPNPQPPSAVGTDLRTLVAQVLHDPGVRPPLPLTNLGPPTVRTEELGV